jgi:hypothetical protein
VTYTEEVTKEINTEGLEESATAVRSICLTLFPGDNRRTFRFSRTAYWVDSYPLETVLYALTEAKLKQKRTDRMTLEQVATFAETVMLRRSRQAA